MEAQQVERKRGRPRKEDYEAFKEKVSESPDDSSQEDNRAGLSVVAESGTDEVEVLKDDILMEGATVISPGDGYISEPPVQPLANKAEFVREVADKSPPYGWQDITSAPRNGTPIEVMDELNTNIANVYWKKTRAFANPTHKWQETGFWCGELSGQKINFSPVYWRQRSWRR